MPFVVEDEAEVEFDAVAYLSSKGLTGKISGREVAYPCFFDCGEPPGSRKHKLYVSPQSGWYYCFKCGARGGSYLLQRHFGDEPDKVSATSKIGRVRDLLEAASDAAQTALMGTERWLTHLLVERGFTADTILERRLGLAPGGRWSLIANGEADPEVLHASGLVHIGGERDGQDFFYDHLMIPYIQLGAVVQLRGKALSGNAAGRYMTGPRQKARAYNLDSLHGADEVILTEGELDCVSIAQALSLSPNDRLRRMAVVGLPGVQTFPDELKERLADVKRVYVGFDPDNAGRAGAVKVRELLGAKVRVLQLPIDAPKCDWSEFLLPAQAPDLTELDPQDWEARHPHRGHDADDILTMLDDAAGKRIFSVADCRRAFERDRGPGIKLGFRSLDAVIGGVQPGQLVIPLSKTGTGKTNLLVNLAYSLRSIPTVFFSLEMTREEVYMRLERVARFHFPLATGPEIDATLANLWVCDVNRLNEDEFMGIIDEYATETGVKPEVCMVDYLGYFARGMAGGSPYEKVTSAAMTLKGMAKSSRTVVISPGQVNRSADLGKPIDLDSARDSGAIEETADFLMGLWNPDQAQQEDASIQPQGRIRLGLLKSRHGGAGRIFNLQYDPLTLAIVDADDPMARKASDHVYDHWRGLTYQKLRERETAPTQLPLART